MLNFQCILSRVFLKYSVAVGEAPPPIFHGLFVQFEDLASPGAQIQSVVSVTSQISPHLPLCLKLLLLWFGKFVQSVVGEAFKSLVMAEYPYIVKTWH